MKHKRISIVIPVYNEETALAACLQAIAASDRLADEVIVVDNNSTDNSRTVAASFPFVRILEQKKQGVSFARDMGFNAARGDIIARIDADTKVTPTWISQIADIFDDQTVDAVSGSLHYYDIGWSRAVDRVDLGVRRWLTERMDENQFLLGANMAIRRSAWLAVKREVCSGKHMHEDLDLAVHMSDYGQKVIFDERLKAGVSSRRIDARFGEFLSYMRLSPKTYALHSAQEYKYMYPVIAVVTFHYLLLRVLFRGYDSRLGRFSWRQLLSQPTTTRVNPATFS